MISSQSAKAIAENKIKTAKSERINSVPGILEKIEKVIIREAEKNNWAECFFDVTIGEYEEDSEFALAISEPLRALGYEVEWSMANNEFGDCWKYLFVSWF